MSFSVNVCSSDVLVDPGEGIDKLCYSYHLTIAFSQNYH